MTLSPTANRSRAASSRAAAATAEGHAQLAGEVALDGFHVHLQRLRPVLQRGFIAGVLLQVLADPQQARVAWRRQVQRQHVHAVQFVQQQAHHAAIAAVLDVLALDQRGGLQQLAQQGDTCTANGSVGRCGANDGSMYRLRMCTAAMQSTACTIPAGIQIARFEGTTQRPTSERTTIRPEGVDQLVALVLVPGNVGAHRVLGDPIGDRTVQGNLPPGRGRIDVAGDVLLR